MGKDNVFTTIPYVQLREHSTIFYRLPTEYVYRNNTAGRKGYSGEMTSNSIKRIRLAIEILMQRSPVRKVWNKFSYSWNTLRITFVTLTISTTRIVCHRVAHKCLAMFIRTMKIKYNANDYIWKAELQKRGQIHYHITFNVFIPHDDLRRIWNNIQARQGWLDTPNANSTDIHAVFKVDRIDLYLSKYIAKDGGKIDGKVWDCSKSIKGKKLYSIVGGTDAYEAIYDAPGQYKKMEHCYIKEAKNPWNALADSDLQEYKTHIFS